LDCVDNDSVKVPSDPAPEATNPETAESDCHSVTCDVVRWVRKLADECIEPKFVPKMATSNDPEEAKDPECAETVATS
jgi:hypothetical protein